MWGWARTAGSPGIKWREWLGEGETLWRPLQALLPGPSQLRGISRACVRPSFNSSSSENSSSCGPFPHRLSRWEGKKLPQVKGSELAACKSLNGKPEEEVGVPREWILMWDGWEGGGRVRDSCSLFAVTLRPKFVEVVCYYTISVGHLRLLTAAVTFHN